MTAAWKFAQIMSEMCGKCVQALPSLEFRLHGRLAPSGFAHPALHILRLHRLAAHPIGGEIERAAPHVAIQFPDRPGVLDREHLEVGALDDVLRRFPGSDLLRQEPHQRRMLIPHERRER